MSEQLEHWTVVTHYSDHYDINCQCGWSSYAIDWQHAVTVAKTHSESGKETP